MRKKFILDRFDDAVERAMPVILPLIALWIIGVLLDWPWAIKIMDWLEMPAGFVNLAFACLVMFLGIVGAVRLIYKKYGNGGT